MADLRIAADESTLKDVVDSRLRGFVLEGPVERTGYMEMPASTTLGDVIHGIGGGLLKGHTLKAVLVGSPPGILFLPDAVHAPLCEGGSRDTGESAADPEIVRVLDEDTCIVSLVYDQVVSTVRERSAGCSRCRMALERIAPHLMGIIRGEADSDVLDRLHSEAEVLRADPVCDTCRRTANLLLSAFSHFADEFRMHVENKSCPTGVCPRLLLAPCHLACPSSIDIPGYLAFVAHGKYAEALEVIRQDNPFPWVCGLICPHPCERACVRANLDDPIDIKSLKAFVAKWATGRSSYCAPEPAPSNGHKVAVIGSGPAGLTAAHYLALEGYRVTIFESLPVAGGLLVVGIPEYRLPREVVRKEIELIQALGVKIRTGVTVGRDITFDELRSEGYDAFFLGIGAHRGYRLEIEGEDDFPQTFDAITFLREVSLGKRERPAEKVVVVGGGNSAMDAARTCIRLGCREVHVAYRRTREQMPANPEEVEQAMEEGVQFHFLAVPVKIGGSNGRVEYLECLQAELGKPDASGRRRPIPVPDSNFRLEAGAIISAIGQQPDLEGFSGEIPFKITPRNLILTEPTGTRTTVEDIFAGGDAVTGPATVVEAIAAGKQAAIDIAHFLSGKTGSAPVFRAHRRARVDFVPVAAAEKISTRRIPMPLLDPEERRKNFSLVEKGFTEAEAQREARRCLRCDVCIRCGACERTCREAMQVSALEFKDINSTERILSDYERPAERCIACGACALACPTGAIEYIETPDAREVRLCGTVLNRLEAPRCRACGEPFVPQRYLAYVTERSDRVMGKQVLRRLCPQCAREKRAGNFVRL